jgi:SpoVK/Ycf46/Vps4 family AAA+-type ATPase
MYPTQPDQTLTQDIDKLRTLIQSFHPVIAIETPEEERVSTLLQATAQEIGMTVMEWSVTTGLTRSSQPGSNRWQDPCSPQTPQPNSVTEEDPEKLLIFLRDHTAKAIYLLKDFTKHLTNPTIIRRFRELTDQFSSSRSTIILTEQTIDLPPELRQNTYFYDLRLPGPDELTHVAKDVVRSLRIQNKVAIDVQENDIPKLVEALSGMTLKQARQVIAHAALEDNKLCLQDISNILKRKAQIIQKDSILEFFPVQDEALSLGGFNGLKQWLTRASVGFTPQARHLNLPVPKGILIVGIQGCGKSLAAKTIAKAWNMPLLKLDAGKIYNKYVGESEQNFRRAIALAESMAPAILWIDEIEKSIGSGNSGEADGGLSQRLFGSLLTWMQEKSQSVFVIATANDISRIPPELLRKGRFDEIFFVDLPDERERSQILQIHLHRHKQVIQNFDLVELITATDGFSGAEIEQAIITALYGALAQQIALTTPDLVKAIKATIPLSQSRRTDVEHLRAIAKTSFVSVK